MPARVPAVLVFTDAAQAATRARGVVETVARALAQPCPDVAIVVRAKDRPLVDVRALCAALRPMVARARALLLVHGEVALVRELALDGAHLSSAQDADAARAQLPPGTLLGASRHAGEPIGALDYATLSPVFSPTSKPQDTRAPLGLEGLRAACAASPVPLLALGGVTAANARACREAGAHGVAVLGGVMAAQDPARALDALRTAVRVALSRG